MTTESTAQTERQATDHKEINVFYYVVWMRNIPPEQTPRPRPLEVFYVAINVIEDGREYNGVKISPSFRTEDEASNFLDNCGVHGAYGLKATLDLRNDAEREEHELEIFGCKKTESLSEVPH